VEEARKLRQRFGLGMRLLDDLGWGEDDPGEEFAVTMELAALERSVQRNTALVWTWRRTTLRDVRESPWRDHPSHPHVQVGQVVVGSCS
jgi:hypothetical protein